MSKSRIPQNGEHGGALVCVVARYDDGTERVLTGGEVAHVNWETEAVRLRTIVEKLGKEGRRIASGMQDPIGLGIELTLVATRGGCVINPADDGVEPQVRAKAELYPAAIRLAREAAELASGCQGAAKGEASA